MVASKKKSAPAETERGLSPGARSLVSLALFMHLFCLLVVFSANLWPSAVQVRLLRFFAPYTRLLNFDPNFTPFQLTHGSLEDVDHRIEVLPVGKDENNPADWIAVPAEEPRASERYRRYQRLAGVLGFFAGQPNSNTPSLLARSVAGRVLNQEGVKPQQIRCRRHLLQSMEALARGSPEEADPASALYFQDAYHAHVVVDGTQVEVMKVEQAGQVARPDGKK